MRSDPFGVRRAGQAGGRTGSDEAKAADHGIRSFLVVAWCGCWEAAVRFRIDYRTCVLMWSVECKGVSRAAEVRRVGSPLTPVSKPPSACGISPRGAGGERKRRSTRRSPEGGGTGWGDLGMGLADAVGSSSAAAFWGTGPAVQGIGRASLRSGRRLVAEQ